MHAPVREIRTTSPAVRASDIPGEVSEEDLERMSSMMQSSFEAGGDVSLLLVFENYQGNELGALADADVIKTHFSSLANLHRYAVVGAPSHMNAMLATLNVLIPVEAKTFDKSEIAAAWEHVGARPADV